MGLLNFWGRNSAKNGNMGATANANGANDAGDSVYVQNELLGAYTDLSYEECRDIYRFWPLGKRVASALPNFAMSAGRKFIIKNAPPEVIDKIEKTAIDMNIEAIVNNACIYARIYGIAFIYIANKDTPDKPFLYKDILEPHSFNILDPLAMGGSIRIDIDPTSPFFNKPVDYRIKGNLVHSQRIFYCTNDIPLYYKWNPSSYSWSGPSIYQNMTLLIRSWNRSIIAIQRMATKAASIIVKRKDISYDTGVSLKAIEHNLNMIRNMENDGIASVRTGEEIEFFQLTGIAEIDVIINKLHSALMMALNDTPSGILLDKNLAQSMSDGDNDMKAIIIAVDKFRKDTLTPIYNFLDKFLLYKAFDADFIKDIIKKYPDLYAKMGVNLIRENWISNYTFEYNNIYPLSENEMADTQSKQLDNMQKIKDLGGDLAGIEEFINGIYPEGDFILSEENLPQEGEQLSTQGQGEAPKGIDSPDTEL